jgi:ureidoacrylate peracid hydrolase
MHSPAETLTRDEQPFHYSTPTFVTDAVRKRLGRLITYPVLHAKSTALVVIDMQNHFVCATVPNAVPQARGIVPAINGMANALRAAGGKVIWVQTTAEGALQAWPNHHANFLSASSTTQRLASLAEDSPAYRLYPALDVHSIDHFARKIKYSAMIDDSSELPSLLGALNIDSLLIAGTVTNTCCETTARDASMRNYKVVMLSDANAARERSLHEAALNNFQLYFGDVASTHDVMQRLTG